MAVRGIRVVGPVVMVLWLGACSSHVRHGSALYAEGRYVEAAEVFEHTEPRLTRASSREKAEYGTYRGLTLLVLGDIRNAHRWLAYAYEVERFFPGSLRPRQRAALDRGWLELGACLELLRLQPSAPPTAVAATAPPGPATTPAPSSEPTGIRRSLVGQ